MKQFIQPKREKTVFSIGGRGHFENPISDVMAFYLDPSEEHNFGTLFISSFLTVLGKNLEIIEESPIEKIEREAVTLSGNRIDIVAASENWVLVIENKIYHSLLNPLDDYELYVKAKYPNRDHILVVLSLNGLSGIPDNWNNILYQELIEEIKKQAGPFMFTSSNAKWSFFLRDFILNLEELIGEQKVDKQLMDFAQKNYSRMLELLEIKEQYIDSLRRMFSSVLLETTGSAVLDKVHNWSKRTAIRFYCPDKWGEKTNLVLVVLPQGDFKIYYYVYGIEEQHHEAENKRLIRNDYNHWKENKGTILCYKSEKRFDMEGAKEEFTFAAQHLNHYFSS